MHYLLQVAESAEALSRYQWIAIVVVLALTVLGIVRYYLKDRDKLTRRIDEIQDERLTEYKELVQRYERTIEGLTDALRGIKERIH